MAWKSSNYRLAACLLLLIGGLTDQAVRLGRAGAQEAPASRTTTAERKPRVLLLGDSISIGYTPFVQEMLAGEAVVLRPMRDGERAENCAGTNRGVQNISRWLELGDGDWDVIHFNLGLHDIKRVDPETGANSSNPNDPRQAPPAQYERQLREIVETLKATGAKLIFATTTPVPEGGVRPHRDVDDPARYNDIARRIMREADVAINDLCEFAEPRLAEIQRPVNVHFTEEGSRALAQQVVMHVRQALARRNSDSTQRAAPQPRGYTIPTLDLAGQTNRQVVVDRESGQYLGHPTTALLEDGKTMLCVYPKGHGRGAIVYRRSDDGGLTWSERLPTPASWATSKEVPTLHRVVDAGGKNRLIMWSGLYPARLAVSEDDGATFSELEAAGDWGGIVVMGCVVELNDAPGHYMAMFHDDGRFFRAGGERKEVMTLYKTFSTDGGLTWSFPETIFARSDVHLCEPGCFRSPDGQQLAVLMRENRRRRNSYVIFSDDEGQTWSEPRELPAALTGDRHTGCYAPDGRLFISFRDTTLESPTKGDWVGWVGTYDDIREGREGQYRVRLMDNHKGADCAYPGVEMLPDGTLVTTTYGHWTPDEPPYIVSVRLKLDELDALAR